MSMDDQQDTAIVMLSRGDDKDVELITSLLEKVGLRVLSSSNANDALEHFSVAGDSVRLLIIDEGASPAITPGFLECVHSANPRIRVLLISERDPSDPGQSWITQANIRVRLKNF
jgi:hypothetical protein